MGREKRRDRKPLIVVRALVASLPLILKLVLVFLKYKRAAKKRKKLFRKTLKKEGLDDQVAERLSNELPELRIREMMKDGGKFKPF
ncbi:MAG: hypothetical protein V5A88_05425 [Candidatus Thermoplasmatota archaeon]